MNEVVLNIAPEPNESAEAKKFRQGIIQDIENAEIIAKEKNLEGWYVDYTPEFPQIQILKNPLSGAVKFKKGLAI